MAICNFCKQEIGSATAGYDHFCKLKLEFQQAEKEKRLKNNERNKRNTDRLLKGGNK